MKLGNFFALLTVFLFISACASSVPDEPPVIMDLDTDTEPQPSCDDGIKNQGEEGIDCGGPCSACPSCSDGIKNQGEDGIDCGGPCSACPSCSDGIKNQGEVDIDCGGPCKPCEVEYMINAQEGIKLREKLKPSTKAVFLTDSYPTGLDIGESHVFPLGITNTYTDGLRDFKLFVQFKDAKDSKSNPISGVDSGTVSSWFSENKFATYNLDTYGQEFIPVGVTVGEYISPGVETLPGNYYFQLIVQYDRGRAVFDEYTKLDFSFRVK